MTLELHCDRMRFAPAGWVDAQEMARKQGLSIRVLRDGATHVGAFQARPDNAEIRPEGTSRSDVQVCRRPSSCGGTKMPSPRRRAAPSGLA